MNATTRENGRRRRDAEGARTALVEAASRLLPDRSPNAISGRDLAAEAGINYGLIHHHFGSKDAVLQAGLDALRDDFVRTVGDVTAAPLLGRDPHPFLRAVMRWSVDDPAGGRDHGELSIGDSMVTAIAGRLGEDLHGDPSAASAEAKARAIAAMAIQLSYAVLGGGLLPAVSAGDDAAEVEASLAGLYDGLVLRAASPTPGRPGTAGAARA